MTQIQARTALVTGAASGLGRRMATAFTRLGGRVVLWDVDHDGAVAAAKALQAEGAHAWAYRCDVSHRDDVAATAKGAPR